MNPIYATFTIWLCCWFIVKQSAVINISKMQVCSAKVTVCSLQTITHLFKKGIRPNFYCNGYKLGRRRRKSHAQAVRERSCKLPFVSLKKSDNHILLLLFQMVELWKLTEFLLRIKSSFPKSQSSFLPQMKMRKSVKINFKCAF